MFFSGNMQTLTGFPIKETDPIEESQLPSHQDPGQSTRPRFKNTIHLWEFLLELLGNERYSSIIAWTRREDGEFKLKNHEEVARQWGLLKQRKGMNYDKMSRALRYYYKKDIIMKVRGQRLVYKFHKLPYEYKSLRYMNDEMRRSQLHYPRPIVIQPTQSSFTALPQSHVAITSTGNQCPVPRGQIPIHQILTHPYSGGFTANGFELMSRRLCRSQVIFPATCEFIIPKGHALQNNTKATEVEHSIKGSASPSRLSHG